MAVEPILPGIELRSRPEGVLLPLRVAAGSARERLVGPHGGRLKIAVRAAPERGKANRAVLDLLASSIGVPRRDLDLAAGETSPDKMVLVRGLTPEVLAERLRAALS